MYKDITILGIIFVIDIICFLLGYTIGQINCGKIISLNKNNIFSRTAINDKHNKISIDDRKYVVDIDTNGLEKKYAELGEEIVSNQGINETVNKLKNIKKI